MTAPSLDTGEAINWEGMTGGMDYTETGAVSGLFGAFKWTDLETLEQEAIVDGPVVLELDQN